MLLRICDTYHNTIRAQGIAYLPAEAQSYCHVLMRVCTFAHDLLICWGRGETRPSHEAELRCTRPVQSGLSEAMTQCINS